MKLIKCQLLLAALVIFAGTSYAQKQFTLTSPNKEIEIAVEVSKTTVQYSVSHNKDLILSPSPISMELNNKMYFGINPKLSGATTKTVNAVINSPFYKKSSITDNYNELTLRFKDGYNIIFRAYDEGIAYRFVSTLKKPFSVENEQATFNFPSNQKAYIPYVKSEKGASFDKQFFNSFENTYEYTLLSDWDKERLAFAPILVEAINGKKVCITEADLLNYPGMYLHNKSGASSLEGVFAPYPKDIEQGGHNMLQGIVKSRDSYIAKFDGATSFPWRVVVISENDHELANNDMIYKLATPSKVTDTSWIKPGKVAWEWWNDWNLYGVDFKTGVNNETYKYYIDFAAQHGIEYVILDEGWAVNLQADMMQVVPEINLPELVNYGKNKNVGIVLWGGYHAFDKDMESICKHYSEMGVKGFKIDFMDRDDQAMVDFHRRGAEISAKHKLLINYHGTYKPTGLNRTYPSVINYEGVNGLEQMKWAPLEMDQVTYDVTIPFIRMVAGPFDYTQGAMLNGTKSSYRPSWSEAMSQGTRCRQLAEYIIFESPLNMLCDNPSNYNREPECTEFIASVPTVWDQTISLNGKVAEYISIARQKGDTWYVGSLTNWDERSLELDLSFLGEGSFKAEVFRDGINANKASRDYKKETIDIPSNKKLKISMASGGGYVAKITKK